MRILPIFILCLCIVGCATVSKVNRISTGMEKEEVIQALGMPVSTTEKDGAEYMNYRFVESTYDAWMSFGGGNVPYYVKIVNGKVAEYGRQEAK